MRHDMSYMPQVLPHWYSFMVCIRIMRIGFTAEKIRILYRGEEAASIYLDDMRYLLQSIIHYGLTASRAIPRWFLYGDIKPMLPRQFTGYAPRLAYSAKLIAARRCTTIIKMSSASSNYGG